MYAYTGTHVRIHILNDKDRDWDHIPITMQLCAYRNARTHLILGSFWVWAHPMRDDVTVEGIEGILPKGPYLPCVSMAGRALLAGYPSIYHQRCWSTLFQTIYIWFKTMLINIFDDIYILLSLCHNENDEICSWCRNTLTYTIIWLDNYSLLSSNII